MSINQSGWKPTAPEAGEAETGTFTGNRALMLEQPLLFEIGDIETTGVDFAARSPAEAGAQAGPGLDPGLRRGTWRVSNAPLPSALPA